MPAAQGTIALDGFGGWVFTPAPGFTGTAMISYTFVDADGAHDASARTCVDVAANAPPALTDPDLGHGAVHRSRQPRQPDRAGQRQHGVSRRLDPYYADPNGNTMTLVVDLSGLPSWLSYDRGTHTFSGTPPVATRWRRRHPRDGDGRCTARASCRR